MNLKQSAIILGALVLNCPSLALAADLHVPTDHATIQEAVNAATPGDTIHIAPGIYKEQTWITEKNLTLVGEPGTILRAFPGMQPGLAGVVDARCIIFIGDSSNVIIRNLAFEGDQLADQNDVALKGVNFDVSGGAVENCRFTGFREPTPGSKFATAVHFWNGLAGAARYQARVVNTIIEDCYTGVTIVGAPGKTSYDVSVLDNTIVGVGLTTATDFLQGLKLEDGTAGKVARNTIRGFSYDGSIGPNPDQHSIPFGILRYKKNFSESLPLEPVIFEENVLRDNQVHLAFLESDDCVVRNNTFDGNVAFTMPPLRLQRSVAVWFSGDNAQVIGNQFRNLEQGIRMLGGVPLGVATNAMLIDNRFCDVDTPLFGEPGADFTEQGSLNCPYPEPELNIAGAVLLSWPKIEEGFVVESAPTPDGPWTAVNATPFVQGENHTVSIPTNGDQKYFRLVKP